MTNYQEERELNQQINNKQIKICSRNKKITILKLNKKYFEVEQLPHELFLTRQATKIRNAFANNISTDTKLSRVKISKLIQSGGSFDSSLSNLGKKSLTNIAVPSARNNLPGLVSNLT